MDRFGNMMRSEMKVNGAGRRTDMFGKKKKVHKSYDPQTQKPVIHSSICTGEKVAGFKDLRDGRFEEVMLIRGEQDFLEFLETYDISRDSVGTEY